MHFLIFFHSWSVPIVAMLNKCHALFELPVQRTESFYRSIEEITIITLLLTDIIQVVYFRWERNKMHHGAQTKVCEVNRSSMGWPNWTQETVLEHLWACERIGVDEW